MSYTQIEDEYFDQHYDVSRSASLLDIEGKVWSNRSHTDGSIPRAMLRRLTSSDDPDGDAAELVAAGMWEVTATGWQIDWTHQQTAEQVRATRARNAARQKRFRDKQNDREARHGRGDHGLCSAPYCDAVTRDVTRYETGHVIGDETGDETRDETPSHPDPAQPSQSLPSPARRVEGWEGTGWAGEAVGAASPVGVPAPDPALARQPDTATPPDSSAWEDYQRLRNATVTLYDLDDDTDDTEDDLPAWLRREAREGGEDGA